MQEISKVGFGFSQVITSCGRGRCLHVLTFLPELRCQRLVSAIHLYMTHNTSLLVTHVTPVYTDTLVLHHYHHCIFATMHRILPFLRDWHLEPRRLIPNRVTFNSLLSACDGAGHSTNPYPSSRQAPTQFKDIISICQKP